MPLGTYGQLFLHRINRPEPSQNTVLFLFQCGYDLFPLDMLFRLYKIFGLTQSTFLLLSTIANRFDNTRECQDMTIEHKINLLLAIAVGLVVTIIAAIVADQTKANLANQAPCPVASQSASSQLLVPDPIPSASDEPRKELHLGEITIPGSPSSSSSDPWEEPSKVDYSCRCEDEGKSFEGMPLTRIGNILISMTMYCHLGLLLTPFEGHPDGFYRNECRPKGKPLLKSCLIGNICDMHDVEEGALCEAGPKQVALCKCGLILNYSSPALRGTVQRIHCDDEDERKSPPSLPPQCAPQSGPDSISL